MTDQSIHKEEMNIRGISRLGSRLSDQDILWFKDDLISKKQEEIDKFGKEYLLHHKDYEIMRNMMRVGGKYFDLVQEKWLNEFINTVLNPAAIIQDCFGMVTRPTERSEMTSYKFHRDQPWIKETRTSVFVFIPLVDFTEENGATECVPGTHLFKRIPSQEYLEKHSERFSAKAGDAIAMDAAVWHRAGVNRSQEPRPMLFLKYQLAFMKQPIDLCTACSPLLADAPELVKQRLGWDSRQMADHEEYRNPDRGWKSGQYCTDNCGIFDGKNVHEYK